MKTGPRVNLLPVLPLISEQSNNIVLEFCLRVHLCRFSREDMCWGPKIL